MTCTHTTNGVASQPAGTSTTPDPTRHVRYDLGMVLGVEDFTQEFTYLSGRDHWLARDLLGYGTASGLAVTITLTEPEVVVAPGVALSPKGRLIRIFPAQCARIRDWLALHQAQLQERGGPALSRTESLFVVLSYRECPTDPVPIPGEACRSEGDALRPSRWKDDFRLELTFRAPDQREEDAVRSFVGWLRQVVVADGSGPFTSLADFLVAIRTAAGASSPPSSPPDFMAGPPPASLRIPRAQLCEYLRAAFLLWVTELRPRVRAPGLEPQSNRPGSEPTAPAFADDSVLLAELRVPLVRDSAGVWSLVNPTDIQVIQDRRPYLIHLRLLQEWLLCGSRGPAVELTSPPSSGPGPATTVIEETTFGQLSAVGTSFAHSRADHTHGTPPNPIPAHQADANAHSLAGDVTGPVSATVVERLRGVPVNPTAPTANQVLTFQTGQWRPANLPAPPAALVPATTVVGENLFGQGAVVGTSLAYSRADHSHGTPPNPIPAHQADANAHTLAGDVTGPVSATTVERLRGIQVVPGLPSDGQLLTFRAAVGASPNRWQAETFSGNFVGHLGGVAFYNIVAAGVVSPTPALGRTPIYEGLIADVVGAGRVRLFFTSYQQPNGAFMYIVKVLPVFNEQLRNLAVYFLDFASNGIILQVMNGVNPVEIPELERVVLMVEISQYRRA